MMSRNSSPVPLLSVQNLRIASDRGVPILNDVSFDIAPGEVMALVGESGSGKTMAGRAVMRLLPTQVRQTGGQILLDGRDLSTLGDSAMRALRGDTLGMVFQEPMVSLNPAMTVGTQLCEGLKKHRKIDTQEARKLAVAMLSRVRVSDAEGCMSAYPHQFSGGMRQRIMLASVMLLQPKLLIADEPTTALDSLSQREVMDIMVELTRSAGTAVLLVTHDLQLVERYARSVVVLQKGSFVEAGLASQLLRAPKQAYTQRLVDALPQRDVDRALLPPMPPLIEARDVSIAYPGTQRLFSKTASKLAVDRVSLSIKPGEVVAVVGGSGSGKTTLGRALIGLLPLAGGDVRFKGQPLAQAGAAQRREFRLACQMVFQDPYSSLNPRQRVGEIVAEPLDHGEPLTRVQRAARVEQMLAEVGLEGFADRHPHALSGGQRQRVAIARALIRRPALVMADEPVSALDMTIQKQVLSLLKRLQTQHGFACFFVSHNLAAVSAIADRIVVMHEGRLVEEGTVAQIFDAPQHPYTRALLEAAFVEPAMPPMDGELKKLAVF